MMMSAKKSIAKKSNKSNKANVANVAIAIAPEVSIAAAAAQPPNDSERINALIDHYVSLPTSRWHKNNPGDGFKGVRRHTDGGLLFKITKSHHRKRGTIHAVMENDTLHKKPERFTLSADEAEKFHVGYTMPAQPQPAKKPLLPPPPTTAPAKQAPAKPAPAKKPLLPPPTTAPANPAPANRRRQAGAGQADAGANNAEQDQAHQGPAAAGRGADVPRSRARGSPPDGPCAAGRPD